MLRCRFKLMKKLETAAGQIVYHFFPEMQPPLEPSVRFAVQSPIEILLMKEDGAEELKIGEFYNFDVSATSIPERFSPRVD